jgi:hypothetical protein
MAPLSIFLNSGEFSGSSGITLPLEISASTSSTAPKPPDLCSGLWQPAQRFSSTACACRVARPQAGCTIGSASGGGAISAGIGDACVARGFGDLFVDRLNAVADEARTGHRVDEPDHERSAAQHDRAKRT